MGAFSNGTRAVEVVLRDGGAPQPFAAPALGTAGKIYTVMVGRCKLTPGFRNRLHACLQLSKLKYDKLLSKFASNCNLRHYVMGLFAAGIMTLPIQPYLMRLVRFNVAVNEGKPPPGWKEMIKYRGW